MSQEIWRSILKRAGRPLLVVETTDAWAGDPQKGVIITDYRNYDTFVDAESIDMLIHALQRAKEVLR